MHQFVNNSCCICFRRRTSRNLPKNGFGRFKKLRRRWRTKKTTNTTRVKKSKMPERTKKAIQTTKKTRKMTQHIFKRRRRPVLRMRNRKRINSISKKIYRNLLSNRKISSRTRCCLCWPVIWGRNTFTAFGVESPSLTSKIWIVIVRVEQEKTMMTR